MFHNCLIIQIYIFRNWEAYKNGFGDFFLGDFKSATHMENTISRRFMAITLITGMGLTLSKQLR